MDLIKPDKLRLLIYLSAYKSNGIFDLLKLFDKRVYLLACRLAFFQIILQTYVILL